jgi:hypothetical protein
MDEMSPPPPKTKTKLTVQVDEGVEVLVVLEKSTGNPDTTDPSDTSKHPVKADSSTEYTRSYRWNAAGCS